MRLPQTAFVTLREGGEWLPFVAGLGGTTLTAGSTLIHSIKFDDGSVWDAVNGWRDQTRILDERERLWTEAVTEMSAAIPND